MRNVYAVMREKEIEVSRLEKEVEALRVVAPLLSEDKCGFRAMPIRIPRSCRSGFRGHADQGSEIMPIKIPSHADQGSELMPIRKMIESGMV